MEKKKFMRVQKFLILFLILLLSFPLSALAQQQMIKGQVVDDKGETIIGATVMVKGSKDGTLTDIHHDAAADRGKNHADHIDGNQRRHQGK